MSPRRRLSRKHLAKIGQLFIATVLFGTAFSQQASAQIINFTSPVQLVDNDANQGSPTIIAGVNNFIPAQNGHVIMYYVNHSNNTIYADFDLRGNPQSTGIAVWSAEITDVGAAFIYPCRASTCPTMLLSYVAPDQNVSFVTSTDGVHFGPRVVPSPSSLGVGNQNPDPALVPAITSITPGPSLALVATVGGSDHLVYMSETADGQNFIELYGTGQPVSNYRTVSRPSLAFWPGTNQILIGFTSNDPGTRVAVVGPANAGPGAPAVARGDISWGNNNRDGNYAGIALTISAGYIYVFGQDTASSQNLKYIYSTNDTSWSGPVFPGNQMRWTPSLTDSSVVALYLVYQDDGNTNISYRGRQ